VAFYFMPGVEQWYRFLAAVDNVLIDLFRWIDEASNRLLARSFLSTLFRWIDETSNRFQARSFLSTLFRWIDETSNRFQAA
jgi:hypothetical protein